MNWTQWLTLGIAVVGATLGVFNAAWMIRRDTVRLRVRYVTIYVPMADGFTCGVEVTNVGYLPVTITEVALQAHRRSKQRAVFQGDFLRQVELPFRLEARTSITIAGHPDALGEVDRGRFNYCRAGTACGIALIAKIKRPRR